MRTYLKKKTKIKTKEHNNRQNFNICIRNRHNNKEREKKQIIIFERKMYRRILGPIYDNENENWRMLTSKEIYAMVSGSTAVKVLCYRSEGLWFDSRWCHWNFSLA